jgi:hypothetical protein
MGNDALPGIMMQWVQSHADLVPKGGTVEKEPRMNISKLQTRFTWHRLNVHDYRAHTSLHSQIMGGGECNMQFSAAN